MTAAEAGGHTTTHISMTFRPSGTSGRVSCARTGNCASTHRHADSEKDEPTAHAIAQEYRLRHRGVTSSPRRTRIGVRISRGRSIPRKGCSALTRVQATSSRTILPSISTCTLNPEATKVHPSQGRQQAFKRRVAGPDATGLVHVSGGCEARERPSITIPRQAASRFHAASYVRSCGQHPGRAHSRS